MKVQISLVTEMVHSPKVTEISSSYNDTGITATSLLTINEAFITEVNGLNIRTYQLNTLIIIL